MFLYERLGEKLNLEIFKGQIELPLFAGSSFSFFPSFNGLKIGCLLVGIGLGLVVGLFLNIELLLPQNDDWRFREVSGIAYGAPVLFFGGLGLIISFLVEKTHKRNARIQ
jgi:hypothetical protein